MPAVDSYNKLSAITPSDSVDFAERPDAIFVGTGGNLVAVMPDNTTVTMAVVTGSIIPITCRRINSTGTTATGLIALKQV